MKSPQKVRRLIALLCVAAVSLAGVLYDMSQTDNQPTSPHAAQQSVLEGEPTAQQVLAQLPVKGKASKTGYARAQFSNGWARQGGCDLRNIILRRDLEDVHTDEECRVLSGTLHDPYTGKTIQFTRGASTSAAVQIDHVVALSNAWQTGAQQISAEQRHSLANDPLNLIASDGPANQQKSDGDAATWLPKNKAFRCQYVARQVAVKQAYSLWVVPAEKQAIERVLVACPDQPMPVK